MPANVAGPIWGLTPKTQVTAFTAADTTTPKAIYTAGANGARVIGVGVTTDDTAVEDINLYVQVGGAGTARNIGGKRVAALSGAVVASALPAVSLLDGGQIPSLLADGSLLLGAGDVLQAGFVATITAAKTAAFLVQALDY